MDGMTLNHRHRYSTDHAQCLRVTCNFKGCGFSIPRSTLVKACKAGASLSAMLAAEMSPTDRSDIRTNGIAGLDVVG